MGKKALHSVQLPPTRVTRSIAKMFRDLVRHYQCSSSVLVREMIVHEWRRVFEK